MKYNKYIKICLEKFPYSILVEQLKIWGRTWIIDGEKRYPSEEDVRVAIKMCISLQDPARPAKGLFSKEYVPKGYEAYYLNNGWKFFSINIYSTSSNSRNRVVIKYKASRGKNWRAGIPNGSYIKPPGTIIFKVLKDGTTRNGN